MNLMVKKEIEQILNMLYVDNMNTDFSSKNIDVLVPPPAESVRGEYPIGEVTYAGKKLYPFCLREHDWIKHVLVVGASGSGKDKSLFSSFEEFYSQKKTLSCVRLETKLPRYNYRKLWKRCQNLYSRKRCGSFSF